MLYQFDSSCHVFLRLPHFKCGSNAKVLNQNYCIEKQLIIMPKVKCTISEVIPQKKHKQSPIIAHFQNGELSDGFAANLDVCLAKDSENDESGPILVAVSKDNVYDGQIGKGFPTDLKRTFIAIRKKNSEEIKLVEAVECSLMSYHYNNCGKKKPDTSETPGILSSESARRLLFKEFGGKKASKVLDRKEKMKINVDVVKDQLDKTLLEITQSGDAEVDEFDRTKEQQDLVLEELVPKVNKEATKLVDVYNLSDLIESDILDSLNDEAIAVLKASPDTLPIHLKFLAKIIQSIQCSKDPDNPENLLKVKACIYTDALINYFKQVNKVRLNTTVKMEPISQVTTKLDEQIRKKFSQPNVNRLTKTNYVIHKTACYIIVLSLLMSERYEMDVQHIVEEIGIAKTNLIKIISSIAVRPKPKCSNVLSIRLPSQIPALKSNYRRRRTL